MHMQTLKPNSSYAFTSFHLSQGIEALPSALSGAQHLTILIVCYVSNQHGIEILSC